VFSLIFSGKYYHSQIVQRSSDILGLYAQEKALEESEVQILWEACLKDESMKVEVYQLITDAQYKLSSQVMTMFMKKIDAMEPSQMGSRDLAFLYNMVKTAYKNPQVKEAAMVIYFNIAVL
jgi:hypothetical protein